MVGSELPKEPPFPMQAMLLVLYGSSHPCPFSFRFSSVFVPCPPPFCSRCSRNPRSPHSDDDNLISPRRSHGRSTPSHATPPTRHVLATYFPASPTRTSNMSGVSLQLTSSRILFVTSIHANTSCICSISRLLGITDQIVIAQ